ncbi:Serine/threonine-protein kinase [Nymphaea thermarum]|nr:Serine/threonine-protein kinase [Nymphaea thermarum]
MPKMKHIFRKLHIGGSHEPPRSNDADDVATPAQSCGSDDRASPCWTSGAIAVTPSPSSSSSSAPSPAGGGGFASLTAASAGDEQNTVTAPSVAETRVTDFYTSEEEFQYQLALAISASNSDLRNDPDKEQIHAATLMSLGHAPALSVRVGDAAGAQSRRYWEYGLLDYEEKVLDGFYDILSTSAEPAGQGKMPSLIDLQATVVDAGSEIVIVNRAIDPALEELEQISRCIAMDCRAAEGGSVSSRLVQRIADLIVEHMGGPVKDANDTVARWIENSSKLRSSLQTSFLPLGCLKVGLSRHRSLLFKVIADSVGVPCRLVKGSLYTGVDDGAVNIIKAEDDREFLVDLMGAPGTLIPADIFSTKDPASDMNGHKFHNSPLPKATEIPSFDTSTVVSPGSEHNSASGKCNAENSISGWNNASEKMLLEFPHFISSSGAISTVSAASLSSKPTTEDAGASLLHDEVKEKLNGTPYSQEPVDSHQLFADLNPFHIIGPRKQNKVNEDKVIDFQRRRENIAAGPGRPPGPAAWKHRTNEVPRTKQQEFVEGLFPLKNLAVKGSYSSSSSLSNSSIEDMMPEFKNVHVSKISGVSNVKSNKANDVTGVGKLSFLTESFQNKAGQDKEHGNLTCGREAPKNAEVQGRNVYPKNMRAENERRQWTNDGSLGSQESSALTIHASSSKLDPMLDDVAEYEIRWEDLVIGERIGLGSYGEVYHADWNGTEVAVKKFLDQEFSGDALQEFKTEVKIMRRLRHPNVVLFMGAVTRPPHLSIVTEFLPRGSLYKILHRPNCQIDEKRRIRMALDVAKGMNCLHSSVPTIVHRDLKSPNLLVDKNWNVKVCDFGLSRLKHHTFLSSKSTAGTPEWMAPEVLRNEPSNEKCDVYSFGVILWELATLKMPWRGMNPMQVVGAVGFQNRRLEIPKEVDPLVARIIWECWQTDQNLRPSFAQLTAALKPLQQLLVTKNQDSQSTHLPQEVVANSAPSF